MGAKALLGIGAIYVMARNVISHTFVTRETGNSHLLNAIPSLFIVMTSPPPSFGIIMASLPRLICRSIVRIPRRVDVVRGRLFPRIHPALFRFLPMVIWPPDRAADRSLPDVVCHAQ